MKITKKILEKIIKEELSKVIKEYDAEDAEKADALLQQLEKPTGMIGTGAAARGQRVRDKVAAKKEKEELDRQYASPYLNPRGPHKLSDLGEIKMWIRFILGQLDEIDY